MVERKNSSKGLLQLALCGLAIWLLGTIILPSLTALSSNAQQLADFIDESAIDTGQFYYTGIEIVTHAELGARSAVQFSEMRKSILEEETAESSWQQ